MNPDDRWLEFKGFYESHWGPLIAFDPATQRYWTAFAHDCSDDVLDAVLRRVVATYENKYPPKLSTFERARRMVLSERVGQTEAEGRWMKCSLCDGSGWLFDPADTKMPAATPPLPCFCDRGQAILSTHPQWQTSQCDLLRAQWKTLRQQVLSARAAEDARSASIQDVAEEQHTQPPLSPDAVKPSADAIRDVDGEEVEIPF